MADECGGGGASNPERQFARACPASLLYDFGEGLPLFMRCVRRAAAAAVFGLAAAVAPAAALEYDIVINGGSFSAPAAALAAARANPGATILLVEPTDWLGGQSTSQGVAAIDNAWHAPGAALMRDNQSTYYPDDYRDWLTRVKTAPTTAPGEGFAANGSAWVTREAFDPRTAVWALDEMMAETTQVTVMRMAVVKSVATAPVVDDGGAGSVITSLTLVQRTPTGGYTPHSKFLSEELPDWYDADDSADFTKELHTVVARDPGRGLVVIEASELADVIVLANDRYVIGRDSTTEKVAEDGTLPAHDETGSQATVFPFCMTDRAAPDAEAGLKAPFANFDTYLANQTASFFSFGTSNYNRVWTYRRLKNTGANFAFDTVNVGDVTMQNWNPGNDYPYASIFKNKAGATAEAADWAGGVNLSAIADAEKHAVAWYFFMKANRTTAWDTKFLNSTEPLNMMGTAHGLAKFPYMRCVRRGIGLENYRLLDRYFVSTTSGGYTSGTSYRFFDSVGIGNYAADVHPTFTSSGLSPTVSYPAPFYVPYRALASGKVRNLLYSGKTMAQTYATNSAYRLHPIEWAIGSASGTAAGILSRDGDSNRSLLKTPALRAMQAEIDANSPISWALYDSAPIPPQNGDLIVNNLKAVTTGLPFDVEAYHAEGVRARIYRDAVFLHETTNRANGRLAALALTAPGFDATYSAEIYDTTGTLLDVLTAFVKGAGGAAGEIIDNTDGRFSTVGSWTVGSAQADKYLTNYVYLFGNQPAGTATWSFQLVPAGNYEVAVWYPQSSNRATDAPFRITHAGGTATVRINQQVQGGEWRVLGTYQFTGAVGEKVTLANDIADTSKLVVADAIRLLYVAPPAAVAEWPLY